MLDTVLCGLPKQHDDNVLVGFDKSDDAGVYKITDDIALVQTVDFFTPIVDDPYTFGQIAAVNSLSDIYAMGGKPLTSLALVCFEENGNVEVLKEILRGGISKMIEAKCTVIGGHSIRDSEIKFGYSVTGIIHPTAALANSSAEPGDKLILTKAIGTGAISTAMKNDDAEQRWMNSAIQSMTTLNRAAAEVIATSKFAVHALTDITGFGLIGHVREMALGSDVSVRIEASKIPLLEGALECVRRGHIPGGTKANRKFSECAVEFETTVPDDLKWLLFDPQTAGGLLMSVAAKDADNVCESLLSARQQSAIVGEVVESRDWPIMVF